MKGFKIDVSIKGKTCFLWHKWYTWSAKGVTYWKCENCTARRITGEDAKDIEWDFLDEKDIV